MENNTIALKAILIMQQRIYEIAREANEMPLEAMIANLEFLQKAMPKLSSKDAKTWLVDGRRINGLLSMVKSLKDMSDQYNRLREIDKRDKNK